MKKQLLIVLFFLIGIGAANLRWAVLMNDSVSSRKVLNSELVGQDEITCSPAQGGISGNLVGVPDSAFALSCCFMSAECVNGYTALYWALDYFNNPACTQDDRMEGVEYEDLVGWWGYDTFPPFTMTTNDFCSILENMVENYGVLVVEENHVWVVLHLKLKNNGKCRVKYFDSSQEEYEYEELMTPEQFM